MGENGDDVRFKSGSGNTAISCMRNASGHNYRNSSFIVDLAMGQIPRSTERISSYDTHSGIFGNYSKTQTCLCQKKLS